MQRRFLTIATLLCLGTWATLLAQTAKPTPAATTNNVAPRSGTAQPAVPPLEPQGYTYNADGRRDPFVSLLRRGADSDRPAGPRAGGLAGLSSGEITLKGIVASQGGYVAIVLGADNRTYIVHPGEKLADGSITAISAETMTIVQQVNDPLSLQKQHEIRKVLRQTEEAK